MTTVSIDDRVRPWVWKGGGGVAQIACGCGQQMRLLHAWNRASLWQCDACRATVRVKRQLDGEQCEGDSSSN
jgi:hypothetical protein